MERAEIMKTVGTVRTELAGLLSQEGLAPCVRANLEAAMEHIELLAIELGLDVE